MRLNALVDWIIRKLRIKPKSVEQLMLPMMISGWVTGRGIIEFPLGNRWPVASCIYSFTLVSVYSGVIKLTMEYIESGLELALHIGVGRGILGTFLCVAICNTLIGWTSIRSVKMIITSLEASGRKMEKLGIVQDYKFLYWRQSITLLAEIFYIMCMILLVYDWDILDNDEFWTEIFVVIASHHPIILISIGDAAFITLVRALNLKFEQLNRVLKQLSTTTDDSPQHKRVLERTISKCHNVGDGFKKQTNDDSELMRMASEDHYELVTIGSLINETFGTQALLSITFMFYFLVGLLWYVSGHMVWSDLDEDDVRWILISLSWVAFGGYKIFNMISACAKASDECKETAVIICHLHESSTGKAFRDGISDFLLQMTQHAVKFTACGLFPLDHSLFHGMLAAIAIYFIVVVQLGNPGDAGAED